MKLRYNFIISPMADIHIAIPEGEGVIEFNGVIKLQEQETLMIEMLNVGTTEEEIVKAVCEKFGTDEVETKAKVAEIIAQLAEEDLLV